MKIHNNIEQGSPEWHDIRKGKMTASHAQEIGNNGKGLQTYIYKIMAEATSVAAQEHFSNRHMDRGNELEPIARSIYEMETGYDVQEVGFIQYNDYVGCSPDGLVGDDGGIEIKCHDDVGHFKIMVNGEKELSSKYLWQIQMNLLITGREWWDYVGYNPNFEQSLLIFRVLPDKKQHEKLLSGFKIGQDSIEKIMEKICEK